MSKSNAAFDRGTRCSFSASILGAGMVHTLAATSISDHVDSSTSLVRQAVRMVTKTPDFERSQGFCGFWRLNKGDMGTRDTFLTVSLSRRGESRESAEVRYQHDLTEWTAARDAHELERAEIQKAFRLAAKGYSAQMERALDYVLSVIAWPKETLVAYEFSHDATGVALDVDLPDESDIPRRTAEAKGNGKLTFKSRPDRYPRLRGVVLRVSVPGGGRGFRTATSDRQVLGVRLCSAPRSRNGEGGGALHDLRTAFARSMGGVGLR
ncbi:hypothetical protein PS838_03055 [Pseudomonas fluorescens]|nr:hypothetical protein PS838_03055 [Pseudomonas fluorescens]